MILIYILGNVIAPVISGIILLIFASYFFITHSVSTNASRFFVIYLLSFGIFVLMRPVQLFSGGDLIPLYINQFRSFIFLVISVPALTMANLSLIITIQKRRIVMVFVLGASLGVLYLIFNILGANGSYISFSIAGLFAYEPLLPGMTAPYYGREITIAIFMAAGIQIVSSGLFLLKTHYKSILNNHKLHRKFLLFGIGSVILGLSIVSGVLLQSWWIYYLASLFSSLLAGSGVLIDIGEMKLKILKIKPYIKEELTNLIRFKPKRNNELYELFNILEISIKINTFIIMECKESSSYKKSLELFDMIFQEVEPLLLREVGESCFLLVPIGRYKIGICVYIKYPDGKRNSQSIELCEQLVTLFEKRKKLEISFGIGRTGQDVLGLTESYHEAVTAQAYASFFHKSQIIHIEDVQDPTVKDLGQIFDLNDLSISIKTGNIKNALSQFYIHFAGIIQASEGEMEKLRMYSFYLVSTIIHDILSIGIPGINIAEKSNIFFKELLQIQDQENLRTYLIKIIEETVKAIELSQKTKLSKVVINTKKYIDEYSNEQLTGKQVSQFIGMSQSYHHNIFKKETGYTINDYIIKTKINVAKQLLADSDKNITEVAFVVGFNDSNYFSTVFKKIEGMSPNNYRKSLKV